MYENRKNGWVELICGSMFSGKSEELIRRLRRSQFAKQKVLVFKPAIDNRYSELDVVSHNGSSVQAIAVPLAEDILDKATLEYDVIGIDEVQFFDQKITQVVQQLANNGFRVIVAGLDQDFRGEPFGEVPSLMALAERVTKLHAVCTRCGSPASRTQRLIDGNPAHYEDPIILVGAQEAYEARCRQCHVVAGKETRTFSLSKQ